MIRFMSCMPDMVGSATISTKSTPLIDAMTGAADPRRPVYNGQLGVRRFLGKLLFDSRNQLAGSSATHFKLCG